MTTFRFISDAGHGWLKVPIALLKELGIVAQITPYSYMNGDWAYLEEDCDAPKFSKAYEAAGNKFEYDMTTVDRAMCRNYASFKVV